MFSPNLSHRLGRTPLKDLARELDAYILERLGKDIPIDLLGFSMGGVIGRVWMQQMGGSLRTHRFISVGCPHRGTYSAQWIPSFLLPGVAEMKRGSCLIRELNRDVSSLKEVACISFFCKWDLMVFPGWQAKLPVGIAQPIPVLTHRQLISNPLAIQILVNSVLSD